MNFNANIPQPNDLLPNSQQVLLSNNIALSAIFGIDHYPFTDQTANQGFHNKVTTPLIVGGVHPTTTTNPIFYAMQDAAEIGIIQYSRGPSNAIPSPVTELQSPSTPISLVNNASTNVIDCTNITRMVATLYAGNFSTSSGSRNIIIEGVILWNKAIPVFKVIPSASTSGFITIGASGNILQIVNTSGTTINDLYWTLRFHRIQI